MNKSIFDGERILITGGTGSWGTELVKLLLSVSKPKEIRIYSRGEHKQVDMKRRFHKYSCMRYITGDVRDKNRLLMSTKNIDYIFHLAALKHVPICEENPWEAVLTNIIGTQNVIESAITNGVKKVVDVSTDKAVDPLNLYGVTKACGEKLMTSANLMDTKTRFVCVRGGNVLGTNGSVIPLFIQQIKKTNAITITDLSMTRFLMRVRDAVKLVLTAAERSIGGEVFVMKMPSCKIADLADVMIKRLGNSKTQVKIIGMRPGEKLLEVLVSRYEKANTIELDEYFVVLPSIHLPHLKNSDHKKTNTTPFSENEYNAMNTQVLTQPEIEHLLENDGWFTSNNNDDWFDGLSKSDLGKIFEVEGWKNEKT